MTGNISGTSTAVAAGWGRSTTGLVTPEAVVLEFDLAGVGSRLLATLVDILAQAALATAFGLLTRAVAAAVGTGIGDALSFIAGGAVIFLYAPVWEWRTAGRSPGKMAVGLRVVTVDGAPIGARQAFVRGMLALVDFWIPPGGATAMVTIATSRRSQRLGDLVAGTIVVHTRRAEADATAFTFTAPEPWATWARGIDTSGLRPAELRLVRTFVVRATSIGPAGRADLATNLARRVAQRLRFLPPPGLQPEQFLTCVLVAHQYRMAALREGTAWGRSTAPLDRAGAIAVSRPGSTGPSPLDP